MAIHEENGGILGVPCSRERILEMINGNYDFSLQYYALPESMQQGFLDFCTGMGGVPLTYDPFFKRVFDPELYPERLSRFLTLVFGESVTIRRVLIHEGNRILEESSLMIMDIVVELEDGSIADVEIQKIPYLFPGERAACYSSDLIMRQYSRVKGERGKQFSYQDMRRVYTVVLLEKSSKIFHTYPSTFLHRSCQRFDSGLQMEMLQEYIFIPLDMFRKIRDNILEDELDAWLHCLSSQDPKMMWKIAERYPEFQKIYAEIAAFRQDIGGVLLMFSEALKIMDRNTVQLMIDQLQEEMAQQREKMAQQQEEMAQQREEMAQQLKAKDEQLKAKDEQLRELEKRIQELSGKRE